MYVAPKPEHQDFSQWDKRADPKWLLQTDKLPLELVREVGAVAEATNGTFNHSRARPSLLLAAQALGYEGAADRALAHAETLLGSEKAMVRNRGLDMVENIAGIAAAYGDTKTIDSARALGADMRHAYRIAVMGSTHDAGRESFREIVRPGPHALGFTPSPQDTLYAGMALANVNIIQKSLDNGANFNDNSIVNSVARLAEASGQRTQENSLADKQAAAVDLIVKHLKENSPGTLQQVKSVMDPRAQEGRTQLAQAQR